MGNHSHQIGVVACLHVPIPVNRLEVKHLKKLK